MTPLQEALVKHDIRTVIDLWRMGYLLTAEDHRALAQTIVCRRGPKQKPETRLGLERDARILIRYREMKADGIPAEERKQILADEFNRDIRSIENTIGGKDHQRVKAIIDEWGGKIPDN